MKNKKIMLWGYIAVIYALYLTFILINNFTGRTQEHWRFFYAFTQQSNILSLIWLFLFGISCFGQKKFYQIMTNNTLMISLTVYISITFFIVLLVLDPMYQGVWEPFKSTSEFFLHHFTPFMMWLYFFAIKGNGPMKNKNALLILIYPIGYFAFNLFLGANVNYLDGTPAYAYNFANPNNYSNIVSFALFIGMLIIVFYIFGLVLIRFKKYLIKEYY